MSEKSPEYSLNRKNGLISPELDEELNKRLKEDFYMWNWSPRMWFRMLSKYEILDKLRPMFERGRQGTIDDFCSRLRYYYRKAVSEAIEHLIKEHTVKKIGSTDSHAVVKYIPSTFTASTLKY